MDAPDFPLIIIMLSPNDPISFIFVLIALTECQNHVPTQWPHSLFCEILLSLNYAPDSESAPYIDIYLIFSSPSSAPHGFFFLGGGNKIA